MPHWAPLALVHYPKNLSLRSVNQATPFGDTRLVCLHFFKCGNRCYPPFCLHMAMLTSKRPTLVLPSKFDQWNFSRSLTMIMTMWAGGSVWNMPTLITVDRPFVFFYSTCNYGTVWPPQEAGLASQVCLRIDRSQTLAVIGPIVQLAPIQRFSFTECIYFCWNKVARLKPWTTIQFL